MKKKKIIRFYIYPIIILFFLLFNSTRLLAQERSIFVGDLIKIKVSEQGFTEQELREKFKDFEIVNIVENTGFFIVTLRSFQVGEKTVRLGDKELKITVKSTLKEIKRNGIYEGDLKPEKTGLYIRWRILFYFLLFLFIVTGVIHLWKFINKRRDAQLSPFQYFNRQINKIVFKDDKYFVKLTYCLKVYLESRYSCCIKGKTSTEIVEEVKSIPELMQRISIIKTWLDECDYYKFSGVKAVSDKKQKLLDMLMEIVIKIDTTKEEVK